MAMSDKYLETFRQGHILFSENAPSDTMYYLEDGIIGIYKNYGQENQIKVAEITEGFFGEMAIVNDAKRTVTAVILRDSCLQLIPKEDLAGFFKENPGYKEGILKALCDRIRILDRDYITACGCINECVKADQAGTSKDGKLISQMKKIAASVQ